MYVSQGTSPSRPITPIRFQDIHFCNLQRFETDRLAERRGSLGSDSRRLIPHPVSSKSALRQRGIAKVPSKSFVRLLDSGWSPGQARARAKEDLSKGFELLWRLKGQQKCSPPQQAVTFPTKKIHISVRIPSGEAFESSNIHIFRQQSSKRTHIRDYKPLSTPVPGLISSLSKHWLSKPRSTSKVIN